MSLLMKGLSIGVYILWMAAVCGAAQETCAGQLLLLGVMHCAYWAMATGLRGELLVWGSGSIHSISASQHLGKRYPLHGCDMLEPLKVMQKGVGCCHLV